ncbi:carbohydrate kinase [Ruficoccus amylovorans]|uniref:Carbohydrate kinase n=1 Tax=Ruficoccus amylovorans TaxID=1804625 RepID=A0A842HG70_9BACT|nr:PfkB family carbohydrate kinase [Ruficoccus amylovorans]MBC2595190.1 carbohydrate kinase [Ruficoccus amylovorans]
MNSGELAQLLNENRARISGCRAVTGFDAFVDEMISVVDERHHLEAYRRVETISQFGELIKSAAGHSSLREIVVNRREPGGCAINMGDGLAAFGVRVDTFATAGEPCDDAFAAYAGQASLHSWGREPGRTLAFEFADGKLMFSAVTPLSDFTPEYVAGRLADGSFRLACERAGVIALTDWSLYPHMTECWRLLQQEVFKHLSARPRFFIDLVDPSSRSEADIGSMIEALPGFENCGPITLGLNQNEANILSRITGGEALAEPGIAETASQAAVLRRALKIDEVVIHAHKYAVAANASGVHAGEGRFCEKPAKSTGAGDRFNAGYALGLLLELPPQECVALGTASSGLYVRLGRSATLSELIDFLTTS